MVMKKDVKEKLNYRVSVEGVIIRGDKVLLCKRAENAKVAPGVWNVPAGKVKYTEIPTDAVIREIEEETGLKVVKPKEVNVRAFEMEISSEDERAYRLVFTYVVECLDNNEPQINEEHSEYRWVSREELLKNPEYRSLNNDLQMVIVGLFDNA